MSPAELKASLRLPVVAAPMFLVSGTRLLIAASKAGVLGSLPASNARTSKQFEEWLGTITTALKSDSGPSKPYAINLIVRGAESRRFMADLRRID